LVNTDDQESPDARQRRNSGTSIITGRQAMHEFIRNRLSRAKLQQLYVKAALSNFVGYAAGSLVTVLTTYKTVEERALKNLFGILPRRTVVVHVLPEWLEWTLAILLGYLVMEFVRYVINSNKYLLLIDGALRGKARDDGEQSSTTG
jgi:hypothetical protein